jgi:hypothetical protein
LHAKRAKAEIRKLGRIEEEIKKKMGKHKSKIILLAVGKEEDYGWRLRMSVSAHQRVWHGSFTLAERQGKNNGNKHKNIYLMGSTEKGWQWKLDLVVSDKRIIHGPYFYLQNKTQKYRDSRRKADDRWAIRTFPRCWLKQFEIHHTWRDNETCYFLTKEEHLEQDRILREHGLR